MSKLLPFSPRTSNRVLRMRAIPGSWFGSQFATRQPDFVDVWLEPDETIQQPINWGAISGLALALLVSGGFWAALALLIQRVLH